MNTLCNMVTVTKRTPLFLKTALASVLLMSATNPSGANAQSLVEEREAAKRELAPLFFNKSVAVDVQLTDSSGPEFWKSVLGKPLVGCPSKGLDAVNQLTLDFTTEGAGPIAGDLDGFNVKVVSISGFEGGSLAIPTNSTSRTSASYPGPQLSFFFDQTQNVKRAAIDRAAQEIDRCLSSLPPGNYPGDTISQLCPYPQIPVRDQRQTCVVNTNGDITEPLPDGSGYKVVVRQQMMCDSVGYGRAQPTNPGWFSCYQSTYEGKAEIAPGMGGARFARLRAASKVASKKCQIRNSRNSRTGSRKIGRCASKILAQRLAAAQN